MVCPSQNERQKYLWAQFALALRTFSRIGEALNQRLVVPLYGPSLVAVRSFVVLSPSDPLVVWYFIVVLSKFSPFSRKNGRGGIRTLDYFCSFLKDEPLSHSVSS